MNAVDLNMRTGIDLFAGMGGFSEGARCPHCGAHLQIEVTA